jgi:hypothetical protein
MPRGEYGRLASMDPRFFLRDSGRDEATLQALYLELDDCLQSLDAASTLYLHCCDTIDPLFFQSALDLLCFAEADDPDLQAEIADIQRHYPPLLAARLVQLARLRRLRRNFLQLLRLVVAALAQLRREVRRANAIPSVIVQQAAFFVIHGEHPPHARPGFYVGDIRPGVVPV